MSTLLPRRNGWRILIYVVCFLLVLLAFDLLLVSRRHDIRPGFDTTRIVAPLMADGSVDYLTAIENSFGAGVTPQNNAAALIIQALGRRALPSNQPPDGITDRLGLAHLPKQGDYFISYSDFCKEHSAEEEQQPIDAAANPAIWPITFSALTRQWIDENEKPLAVITQASTRPRFFMPFNGGYRPEIVEEVLLPYLNPMRDVSRALLTRALIHLQAGDIAGFRQDVLTVHRLARLLGQGATLIDRLMGVEMETLACQTDRVAAASNKLTSAQAQAIAAELQSLGDFPSLVDTVDHGERYMGLDFLQAMSRVGPVRAGELFNAALNRQAIPPELFRFLPIPYEQSMRAINTFYDGAVAIWRLPTYAERWRADQAWENQIHLGDGNFISRLSSADWAYTFLLPSLGKALGHEESGRVQRNLTEVALSLFAFKADHGNYPAALTELSPQYLRTIPDDSFSSLPFIYLHTAEGYVLYSVGPNMVDDGGHRDTGDDIVASLP